MIWKMAFRQFLKNRIFLNVSYLAVASANPFAVRYPISSFSLNPWSRMPCPYVSRSAFYYFDITQRMIRYLPMQQILNLIRIYNLNRMENNFQEKFFRAEIAKLAIVKEKLKNKESAKFQYSTNYRILSQSVKESKRNQKQQRNQLQSQALTLVSLKLKQLSELKELKERESQLEYDKNQILTICKTSEATLEELKKESNSMFRQRINILQQKNRLERQMKQMTHKSKSDAILLDLKSKQLKEIQQIIEQKCKRQFIESKILQIHSQIDKNEQIIQNIQNVQLPSVEINQNLIDNRKNGIQSISNEIKTYESKSESLSFKLAQQKDESSILIAKITEIQENLYRKAHLKSSIDTENNDICIQIQKQMRNRQEKQLKLIKLRQQMVELDLIGQALQRSFAKQKLRDQDSCQKLKSLAQMRYHHLKTRKSNLSSCTTEALSKMEAPFTYPAQKDNIHELRQRMILRTFQKNA